MAKSVRRIFASSVLLAFLFSSCISTIASASREETLMGYVVKRGKGFVLEADDGDYIVKGKDVSNLADKLVLATGTLTESDKGDFIEVKSIEDIQNTLPE
ncbi:MAG: hypothetical protein ABSG91_03470 [Syntrophobacteraceae bacterium]